MNRRLLTIPGELPPPGIPIPGPTAAVFTRAMVTAAAVRRAGAPDWERTAELSRKKSLTLERAPGNMIAPAGEAGKWGGFYCQMRTVRPAVGSADGSGPCRAAHPCDAEKTADSCNLIQTGQAQVNHHEMAEILSKIITPNVRTCIAPYDQRKKGLPSFPALKTA